MEAEKKTPAVSDVGAWAMNVVSSVSLIMANKQLMSSSGYAFAFGTHLLFSSLLRADLESGSATRLGEFADLAGRLIVRFLAAL